MKTKFNLIYMTKSILAFIFLLAIGCSAPKKEEPAQESMHMQMEDEPLDTAAEPQFAVDSTFQKQIASVFSGYTDLQEAFVSSNLENVKSAVAKLNNVLAGAQGSPVDGAAKMDWSTYKEGMTSDLSKINAAADIKEARSYFPGLTQNMYKSIKAFGLGGKSAWYAYCPMAFNNKGGYWLTGEKKIRNPYFGEEMLICGGIREELK